MLGTYFSLSVSQQSVSSLLLCDLRSLRVKHLRLEGQGMSSKEPKEYEHHVSMGQHGKHRVEEHVSYDKRLSTRGVT